MLCQLWDRLDGTDNLASQLDATNWLGSKIWNRGEMHLCGRLPRSGYCCRRFIRWNSKDEVYLLQTTQMNGTHAELFTYCSLSKYPQSTCH